MKPVDREQIGEAASLVATITLLFCALGIFLHWLPFVALQAGWGSRSFPPSPRELSFGSCQHTAHLTPLAILVLSSVALRFVWLWKGRLYEVIWGAGRVFVDHVVLTFLAGILIVNSSVLLTFSHLLDNRCGPHP